MLHAQNNYFIAQGMKTNTWGENEFADIFETYYKKIYNYIYYRINCHYTTEDLTSQVFEKILIKHNSYSKIKGSFDVWIFAIAKNIVNDYFRSKKKANIISFDIIGEIFSNKKNPETVILQDEANKSFLQVLGILNDKEKNIIALKFGGNLKNTEIAKVLNISESNVGVMLYRIMKKLKSRFEEVDYFEKTKYRK